MNSKVSDTYSFYNREERIRNIHSWHNISLCAAKQHKQQRNSVFITSLSCFPHVPQISRSVNQDIVKMLPITTGNMTQVVHCKMYSSVDSHGVLRFSDMWKHASRELTHIPIIAVFVNQIVLVNVNLCIVDFSRFLTNQNCHVLLIP